MNQCFKCDRRDDEVKLLDVIYENEIVRACEECLLTENLPIIRKASSEQLKEIAKPYSVAARMRRMAGLPMEKKKPDVFVPQTLTLDRLRKPKDYKSILNNRFSQAKSDNRPLNLVDNYTWLVMMARKERKISRKQLADAVGESEDMIKLIEEKFLPDDALRIITKLEQYLKVRLRTDSNIQAPSYRPGPARILKIDSKVADKLTIDDLRRMKEAKQAELKEDLNVSEFVWNASKPGKQEDKKLVGESVDISE